MGEVLINHMFNGDYLKENIGHEVINLFKSDNGNHYCYAMSAGDYDTKRHSVITKVILVRNVDQYRAEVLGIADVDEEVFRNQLDAPDSYITLPSVDQLVKGHFMDEVDSNGIKKPATKLSRIRCYRSVHEKQIRYIKDNSITYGGVPLNEIFDDNPTNGLGSSIYITFKVKNFRKPKDSIYLCDNRVAADFHNFVLSNKDRMCGASVETYEKDDDEELIRLYGSEFWENEDTSQKIDIKMIGSQSTTLLNIIKKNNDEIVYSNWIAYVLKNDRNLLMKFIKRFTGLDTSFDDISIIRETKDNIDIYYEDSKSIFVFENKIKSSINGTKKKNDITEEEKQFSQLEKYYQFAEEEAEKHSPRKQTKYFIILPNYAYKDLSKLDKYAMFNKYEVIRYSCLHKFFNENRSNLPYYDDFVKSLEYHSAEYINDLYTDMLERLQSAIVLKQ